MYCCLCSTSILSRPAVLHLFRSVFSLLVYGGRISGRERDVEISLGLPRDPYRKELKVTPTISPPFKKKMSMETLSRY